MSLIIGATGFVGQAVRSALADRGKSLRALSRVLRQNTSVGTITADTNWADTVGGASIGPGVSGLPRRENSKRT